MSEQVLSAEVVVISRGSTNRRGDGGGLLATLRKEREGVLMTLPGGLRGGNELSITDTDYSIDYLFELKKNSVTMESGAE